MLNEEMLEQDEGTQSEELPADEVLAEEEIDLSGEGTPSGRFNFTITDFNVSEKQTGVQHVLTFEADEVGFPLSIGYWYTHGNPVAQRAGRGNLKRIAKSATGQPKYNSRTGSPIVGSVVSAVIFEDDDGFARLKQFRPATVNGEAETTEAA